MGNIYQQIYEKSKLIKENIDFNTGINNLFSSEFQGIRDIPDVPIQAVQKEWEEIETYDKNYINRMFSFEKYKHLMFFVNEVLNISNEMMHHPELNIFDLNVDINLFTHDINDVSELDIKLSKIIDEIYEDIRFIQEF